MKTMGRSFVRLWKGTLISLEEILRVFFIRKNRPFLLLLPILLLVALLLAIVSSSGVLAPFVYPLF